MCRSRRRGPAVGRRRARDRLRRFGPAGGLGWLVVMGVMAGRCAGRVVERRPRPALRGRGLLLGGVLLGLVVVGGLVAVVGAAAELDAADDVVA